ncbi:MAG: FliM/FliN family flagellar motor switch protein [Pseudomonadota bacterium]
MAETEMQVDDSAMDVDASAQPVSENAPSDNGASLGSVIALQKIQKLKVRVQAVLGTVPLTISELANLSKGDLIELETKLGEPIDILANGDLIARAEIVVTQDEPPKFGLTLTEIVEANGTASPSK